MTNRNDFDDYGNLRSWQPPKPKMRKDREWSAYPVGTKAHAFNGGAWTRTEHGWKWGGGDTFPTPGADAIGACIELPPNAELTGRASAACEGPR